MRAVAWLGASAVTVLGIVASCTFPDVSGTGAAASSSGGAATATSSGSGTAGSTSSDSGAAGGGGMTGSGGDGGSGAGGAKCQIGDCSVKDKDGDGYDDADCGGDGDDCDDCDETAHPDQPMMPFQTVPTKGKKIWDYNCDTGISKQFTTNTCTAAALCGKTEGVLIGAADVICGAEAPWTTCPLQLNCPPATTETQGCR